MPSSSTRSTCLETTLHYHYRLAFTRLWSSGMNPEANFVNTEYAKLLDIDEPELSATIKPRYDPKRSIFAVYTEDCKAWDELQKSNRSLRRSEKISHAGTALADTGAVLFKAGRAKEAAKFCEFADTVWEMATIAYEEEEYYGKYK